jgi:hypothetical protein
VVGITATDPLEIWDDDDAACASETEMMTYNRRSITIEQLRRAKAIALAAMKDAAMKDIAKEVAAKAVDVEGDVEDDDECQCCICLDRPPAIVFVPCGHVPICRTCVWTKDYCPLCMASIETRLEMAG